MAAEERTYKSLADALPEVGKVRRLNLTKQNLTIFPSEIGKLTNLYHLNLSGNQLQELPKQLFSLKS
ncbi:MAG: hypothetical protein HC806_07390 [Anaerolineae bacterium]|nr:hypothetical protein [Anaerolineae bacterium]